MGAHGTQTLAQAGTYTSNLAAKARDSNVNNVWTNGVSGTGNAQILIGGNDGNIDPLYDASKHSKADNDYISDRMTIATSSSSSETSKADSINGEKFTASFSASLNAGYSLQDTIRALDNHSYGNQTSRAYNTESMSGNISQSNKARGHVIIYQGDNSGVETMMAKDRANLLEAYASVMENGRDDVTIVSSEKQFEQALLAARKEAQEHYDATGEKSTLITHAVSHGLKLSGSNEYNDESASGALASKGGGLYHEKDYIGDIAGALSRGPNGEENPFEHSYNSVTACHSGTFDNKQTLAVNNGEIGSSAGFATSGGGDKQDSVAFNFGGKEEAPQQEEEKKEPVAA